MGGGEMNRELAMREAAFDMIEAGIRLDHAASKQRDNIRYDGEWRIDYDASLGMALDELDRRRKMARGEAAE
jgi:hypothetical protein